MSSLISPGPGTPGQVAFPAPWLGLQDWPNNFPQGVESGFPDQLNQENFQQNADVHERQEQSHHDAVNETSTLRVGPKEFNNESGSSAAPEIPIEGTQTGVSTFMSPPSARNASAEATAENAKRLKELRALLMAKKPKETHDPGSSIGTQGSEPARSLGRAQSTNNATLPRDPQADVHLKAMNMSPMSTSHTSQQPNAQPLAPDGKSTVAGLDSLLDEVRNEVDGKEITSLSSNQQQVNGLVPTRAGREDKTPSAKAVSIPHRPSSAQQRSSSEEGEIRSDEDVTPVKSKQAPVPGLSMSKEASIDSEEKSRRESEVEAAYKQPSLPSKDTQEKKRRQSQVDFAYSPLRKSSGASNKSGKPPLDVSAVQRKVSNAAQTPKSAVEPTARPWVNQSRPRAAECDSYIPVYRKSAINEQPVENDARTLSKRAVVGEASRMEDRDRGLKQTAKAAQDHRRALDLRPQPPRVISHTETTYIGRIDDETNEDTNGMPKSGQLALQSIDDIDIRDWLELTEYFDEAFRTSRLARFRKKKELDRLRHQLDEEEQLEMQQRSLFRSTGFGNEQTPKSTNMGAPPLTMPSTAVQADPQVSTPILKRQHAEDDTDSRSKFARPNPPLRGGAPTVKDEAVKPLPLEHRITRDDGHLGSRYRPRSRSPERTRRRSASPDLRRNSVPDHTYRRTCHNCGEPGHYQTTCPLPRRDGKDRYRGPQPKARADGVNLNYLGKNTQAGYQGPRAPGFGSSNRSLDDDDKRP